MYETELKHVRKKILRLHKHGKLEGKDICVFGASENGRQIISILRELGYKPICVFDNDKTKQNSYCAGIRVTTPQTVTGRNIIVLIYSFWWKEMELQMKKCGFDSSSICALSRSNATVVGSLWICLLGKAVHRKLLRKYGNTPVFLCPYTGTGDVYLIGTFWNEYISRNGIEDYMFLVISSACKKVTMLFNIKNVEIISQKESRRLIQYYLLCQEEINLKLLNDAWAQINSNLSEWFRGYKGLYFMELFRKFVFDLPDSSIPEIPIFSDASEELDMLFEKYGLKENKTVILSPYSNTLADLPNEFWEKMDDGLTEKGYIVCTNSSGKREPPIAGSTAVFFPLNIAPQFVARAGCFIGIRSGLCDVISGAKAKKIILYDAENRFYNCSAYEYFSLNHMKLCDDAIEIEYNRSDWEKVIDNILNYL